MIYGLIALGSNIGDKKSNIKNAYAELENNNITIISKI